MSKKAEKLLNEWAKLFWKKAEIRQTFKSWDDFKNNKSESNRWYNSHFENFAEFCAKKSCAPKQEKT